MQVDFLIVGQGICGTFLSWWLRKERKSFTIIDNNYSQTPSRMAAGVINPVTGRRMVNAWMSEELLPFTWETYNEMGRELDRDLISQKNIIDFFPDPFMREVFLQRLHEGYVHLHSFPEQNHFNPYFRYYFGCGEIRPVYVADLQNLLPAWRNQLRAHEIRDEEFKLDELVIEKEGIRYRDIQAEFIIFCDGNTSVHNPLFKSLPFAPNKGEMLILRIPDLPSLHIYKKGLTLVPLGEEGLFWAGSDYQWEFDHPHPTSAFRQKTEKTISEWLKVPFTVLDHRAGIRPATLERRPFVGIHPKYHHVGILNGMGAKGCSLAPFFSRQLVDHILYHSPVTAEADIKRYTRILLS